MSESFGARLRRQREERGIDLVAIAELTKIKLSLLEALERDDVSHWPAGIFRRAFVRAYAQAIDLDADLTVREFLELYPDRCEPEIPAALVTPEDAGSSNGGPPTRLRTLVGSAIGSLARLRRGPTGAAHGASPHSVSDSRPVEFPVAHDEPPVEPAIEAAVEPDLGQAADPAIELAPEPVVEPPVESSLAAGAAPEPPKPKMMVNPEPDLLAVAGLCTQFSRVQTTAGVEQLLEQVARILHASGLIVWVWDAPVGALKPALAHGYSDRVIAQLPVVRPTADNAVAAAFRSEQACAVEATEETNGALAVPMIIPAGCAGVLAIELLQGVEQAAWVRAVATIFAAMLAQLIAVEEPAETQERARAH